MYPFDACFVSRGTFRQIWLSQAVLYTKPVHRIYRAQTIRQKHKPTKFSAIRSTALRTEKNARRDALQTEKFESAGGKIHLMPTKPDIKFKPRGSMEEAVQSCFGEKHEPYWVQQTYLYQHDEGVSMRTARTMLQDFEPDVVSAEY